MPIRQALLAQPQNAWLPAWPDEPLASLVLRLKDLGWPPAGAGPHALHIVVDFGGGEFRALRLDRLLAEADHDHPSYVGNLDSHPVRAVERDSLSTGAAQDLARRQPDQLLLVTEDGAPIGVIYEGLALGAPDADPGEVGGFDVTRLYAPGGGLAIDDTHRDFVIIGGVRLERWAMALESAPPPDDLRSGAAPPDSLPPDEAADGGDRPAGAPARFDAHPRVDAPGHVAPQAAFTVTVGFRAEADPTLRNASPIRVQPKRPDDSLTVTLLTDGARVLPDPVTGEVVQRQPLPMRLAASVTFACQAQPDVDEIFLTVEYAYEAQVVGTATRQVVVGADAPPAARRPDPCRLGVPAPESQTDLLLTITRSRSRPGSLQWTILAPRPALQIGPLTTRLDDAREFAALIIQELKTQDYRGAFAAHILANKAQDIADVMPLEFFDALEAVHQELGRAPTLLLVTDETYVPWELALLDHPLDPARPPYLAAQTVMGRWVRHEKVIAPPPVTLDIHRLTAVAAEYGLGTDQRKLKHALDEQTHLRDRWGAGPLKAERAALEPLVVEPRQPGHLIHFAVHGLSDPEGNDQALLLADKTRLLPSALAGRYRCGETATFDFVFLNACQVGTAAACLGQAAGFPGDLIRGGAKGFVAPLWNVDDDLAREFAERFYQATFTDDRSVGEVLYAERQAYDHQGSTTPMAYIYYGHPLLKLKRV
jgi:hypothetical protein